MYEYENVRRRVYVVGDGSVMAFVPVCDRCGRFVRADESVQVNGLGELMDAPNATCSRCGRVEMPFEGWFGEEDCTPCGI